jgi:hypothetical protein
MAVVITPTFELNLIGSANTATKDDWYDVGALSSPSANSPIPSAKQLYIGFALFGSQDKALVYELRANNSGQSAGTTGATTVIAYSATDPTSGSVTSDLFQNGNIRTVIPVSSASTGVEKIWLRVQSGSNTVATFQWFIYYTLV